MTVLITDPLDIKLDPVTGDIDTQALVLGQYATGIAGVKQLIDIALSTVRGEWFLNLDTGLPLFESIFGKVYDERTILDIFQAAILAVPAVSSVKVSASVDRRNRIVTVTWVAQLTFGGNATGTQTQAV